MKLHHKIKLILTPKQPYTFNRTIHKPAGWSLFTPFEIWKNNIMWTSLHIDNILIGLKLHESGKNVIAEIFTKEKLSKQQIDSVRKVLERKLAINDDLKEFYKLGMKDRILRHQIKHLHGMHDTEASDLYAAATLAICLQMAPEKRSMEMWNCLINKYGDLAEFDKVKMHVWPTPKQISKQNTLAMEKKCKLGYRAKFLVQLAKVLVKNPLEFDDLRKLSPEEAKEKLLELPGIGDYSADMVTPYSGFPIDVWSVDVFSKLFYGREPKNGRDAIEKVKAEGNKRWGKYAWTAFFYTVQDLPYLSKKMKMKLRLS